MCFCDYAPIKQVFIMLELKEVRICVYFCLYGKEKPKHLQHSNKR